MWEDSFFEVIVFLDATPTYKSSARQKRDTGFFAFSNMLNTFLDYDLKVNFFSSSIIFYFSYHVADEKVKIIIASLWPIIWLFVRRHSLGIIVHVCRLSIFPISVKSYRQLSYFQFSPIPVKNKSSIPLFISLYPGKCLFLQHRRIPVSEARLISKCTVNCLIVPGERNRPTDFK